MNLNWEENLQSQLRDAQRKIMEAMARQKEAEKAAVASIIAPEAKKLIVPGQ